MPVPFDKPALSVDTQIELLAARGLNIPDRDRARHYLTFIGYYRLSGYVRFYAHPEDRKAERVRPDTSFDQILNLYVFDRKLRSLALDALERIEIAVKSHISNAASVSLNDPFWLENTANFDRGRHDEIKGLIRDAVGNQPTNHQHSFISTFYKNYSNPFPPSWMLMEVLSFHGASITFKHMRGALQNLVASAFRVPAPVMISWLHALSFARNVCAHHARVWNRTFTISPMIPHKYRDIWPATSQKKAYILCAVIHHMMDVIADGSLWTHRLRDLVAEAPAPITHMGFPADWDDQPFWGLRR